MEEKLIEEVKKHKCIYDKSLLSYRKRKTRAEAWESVGEALGYSVLVCQTRWKSLRDRYVKESQNKSGSSWKHFEMMHFLRKRKATNSKDSFCAAEPEQLDCDSLKLIIEIKKHQSIYDKGLITYRNKKARAEAWQSVSKALGTPVELCQSRWKCLRDRYVKETIKAQQASGSPDDVYEKPWKYFRIMDFLRQQVTPRKLLTNVTDSKDSFCSAEPEQQNCQSIQLIEEIKKHETIYDKRCVTYNNRNKRAEAWQSVSEALDIPVKVCQSRWKSLRDRYVREIHLALGSADDERRWNLFEIMDFLRHQVQPRKALIEDSFDSAELEQLNFDSLIELGSEADDEDFEMTDFLQARKVANSVTDSKDSFCSAEAPEEQNCESLIESESNADDYEQFEMMEFLRPKKATNSVTYLNDPISSSSPEQVEQVNCDSLQNTLDETLITPPANKRRGKRKRCSTLQSEDSSSSSSPPTKIIAEKRVRLVRVPAEPDDNQGFFLMCRDLFKKLPSHKVDDAKVFFINHLQAQIKEMWDE